MANIRFFAKSLLKILPDLRVSAMAFHISGDHLLGWERSTRFNTHFGHDILDGDVVVHLLLTY